MPILDERHDFMHPVEGDSAWSESYYFNAYDPVSDSGSSRGLESVRMKAPSTPVFRSGSPGRSLRRSARSDPSTR